jgi:hypothetical protein
MQDAHEFLGQCLDRVKEEVKQGLHDGGAEADGNGPARATPSRFPSPTAPCPSTEVFETEVCTAGRSVNRAVCLSM